VLNLLAITVLMVVIFLYYTIEADPAVNGVLSGCRPCWITNWYGFDTDFNGVCSYTTTLCVV